MDSVEMKENMLEENNTSTTMENNVTNQVATEVTTEKETTQDNATPTTKEELLEQLRAIVETQDLNPKIKVNNIRINFYRLLNAEQEQVAQQTTTEDTEMATQPDPIEVEFKQLLQTYKELREAKNAAILKEMEQNLLRKQHILEQLKNLIEEGADAAGKFPQFKTLQQEWKEIGKIPETNVKEINKAFGRNKQRTARI